MAHRGTKHERFNPVADRLMCFLVQFLSIFILLSMSENVSEILPCQLVGREMPLLEYDPMGSWKRKDSVNGQMQDLVHIYTKRNAHYAETRRLDAYTMSVQWIFLNILRKVTYNVQIRARIRYFTILHWIGFLLEILREMHALRRSHI